MSSGAAIGSTWLCIKLCIVAIFYAIGFDESSLGSLDSSLLRLFIRILFSRSYVEYFKNTSNGSYPGYSFSIFRKYF